MKKIIFPCFPYTFPYFPYFFPYLYIYGNFIFIETRLFQSGVYMKKISILVCFIFLVSISSVYAADGDLKWHTGQVGKANIGGRILTSPAIGSDGTIYVGTGSGDGQLYAVNQDGTLKWKTDFIGDLIYSSPVIGTDGTIYVGTFVGDGELYAIYPTGTLKWHTGQVGKANIGSLIYSSPAIGADGTIYVGTDMGGVGELYAIYSSPGWTYATYENSMRTYTNSNWPKFGQNNYNLRRVVPAPQEVAGRPKSLPITKILKILGLLKEE